MFNVPFNFREGYSSGDPIPVFGSAKAIFWVDDGAVPNAGLTTVWNYFKTKYGFTT